MKLEYSDGIYFCEKQFPIKADDYKTLTIDFDNMDEFLLQWQKIIPIIGKNRLHILRWMTQGWELKHTSKVQEIRYLKDRKKYFENKKSFFKKNRNSNIYSYVEDISDSVLLDTFNFDILSDVTRSVMILTNNTDLEEIWNLFSVSDNGVSRENILKILKQEPYMLIGRLYEWNEEYTVQLIGDSNTINVIAEEISLENKKTSIDK